MRKPIFVRPLSDAERKALEEGLRSSDAFVLRRCQILLQSARGEQGEHPRLVQRSVPKGEPDPKAVSCYGLYLPEEVGETWLRFVNGRPVSGVTTRFLSWCSERLAARGKRVLLLVWDNASWHVSKEVRRWIGEHNRAVKKGVVWG